jgi:hypothetical protein
MQALQKSFRLYYSALTFPDGVVQSHFLIIDQAPSEEAVRLLFSTVMTRATSRLHDVVEIVPGSDPETRRVNFPVNFLRRMQLEKEHLR